MKKVKIRIYIDTAMDKGFEINLNETQSHYLCHVMKVSLGDHVLCFNNKDGEFLSSVSNISKKSVSLSLLEKTRDFERVSDTQLIFAPVKKEQTDYIIQKATELGIHSLLPVITKYTMNERIKTNRFQLQAIEAAEQSRRVDIPEILNPTTFSELITSWNKKRTLFYFDETGLGKNILQTFSQAKEDNLSCISFLIGPEGGFSQDELNILRNSSFAIGVSLGKRILRAETAVAAALSCWQAIAGDWNDIVK